MDLNRLTRDADEQIRKVVARYNQLYAPGGTISQVDLDILLDELRKLYDTFKTIGYINLTRLQHIPKPEVTVHSPSVAGIQASTVPAETAETIAQSESVPKATEPEPRQQDQPPKQAQIQSEPEASYEVTQEPAEKTVTENLNMQNPVTAFKNDESQPSEYETNAEQHSAGNNIEKNVPETNTPQAPPTLADRLNPGGNRSLSETMAATPANDVVGARLLFQPITDLSAGIGINDKFLFVSELFANNAGQYQEAITRINKAVNLDEANWIFQKYHTSAWNQKQETVSRMKDFIKRRFI